MIKIMGYRLRVTGYRLLMIVLLSSTYQLINLSTVSAQLLYDISGNSSRATSYILAVNPLVDQTFIDTIPNAYACFSRCDKVVTEFTMQDHVALQTLRQAALLPDSVRLTNFYTDREYSDIDESLRLALDGLGLQQLGRMKPAYLTELYRNYLLRQWIGFDEQRSIVSFFQDVAAERHMPIYGLDEPGEAIYMLFDREPFHYQCEQLLQIVRYPEREVRLERDILAMYHSGRLTDIAFLITAPDNTSTLSYSDYQVFARRNRGWVKRLQPYLKDGRCFVVLNAMYLGGDQGLLAELRAAGYKVRPHNRRRYTF